MWRFHLIGAVVPSLRLSGATPGFTPPSSPAPGLLPWDPCPAFLWPWCLDSSLSSLLLCVHSLCVCVAPSTTVETLHGPLYWVLISKGLSWKSVALYVTPCVVLMAHPTSKNLKPEGPQLSSLSAGGWALLECHSASSSVPCKSAIEDCKWTHLCPQSQPCFSLQTCFPTFCKRFFKFPLSLWTLSLPLNAQHMAAAPPSQRMWEPADGTSLSSPAQILPQLLSLFPLVIGGAASPEPFPSCMLWTPSPPTVSGSSVEGISLLSQALYLSPLLHFPTSYKLARFSVCILSPHLLSSASSSLVSVAVIHQNPSR